MGDAVASRRVPRENRQRFREKVQLCLDVFERMLQAGEFDDATVLTGMELELNLVDAQGFPAFVNEVLLSELNDPQFCTEIGRFNIEMNVPPRVLSGDSWAQLDSDLRDQLNVVEHAAAKHDAHIAMIGVLPTLMPTHLEGDWMSQVVRYELINDSIFSARGEDIYINIEGEDRLAMYTESIAPESACTSVQLHLQVAPRDFAKYWNAAQVLAAPQVAWSANSPFVFGRRLWDESRLELFKQATDTRTPELRNQGVRPRVFFGERWITSIFDLFEENCRYFPGLIPEVSEEDPVSILETGVAPRLQELRLHNGTVFRWNRPVYDVVAGQPHVRVENRVMSAGPTVCDTIANAMFYYGAVRVLAEDERPVWSKLRFSTAEDNFTACAQRSCDATVYWPGFAEISTDELMLRSLLPIAHDGLRRWGVDDAVREHYLGIMENRVHKGINGARWQVDVVRNAQDRGMDRSTALARMFTMYREFMNSGEPVHTWPCEVPLAIPVPAGPTGHDASHDVAATPTSPSVRMPSARRPTSHSPTQESDQSRSGHTDSVRPTAGNDPQAASTTGGGSASGRPRNPHSRPGRCCDHVTADHGDVLMLS